MLCAITECYKHISDHDAEAEFEKFITQYGKVYATVEEKNLRKEYFRDTYKFIKTYNELNQGLELDINHLADLSPEETANMFRLKKHGFAAVKKTLNLTNVPVQNIDWRARGAVTAVKNQGQCGDCWAFSAVGALEGLYAITNGNLADLSEQYLCNCADETFGNNGCNGGLMDNAFNFVKMYGIPLESSAPYQGVQQQCSPADSAFTISGWVDIPAGDNQQLLQALSIGPVSVAIAANNPVFLYYKSGIISQNCGSSASDLDHGVTLVGTGNSGSTAYWIVKNSWGTTWGQNGYVYIKRDTGHTNGVCQIAAAASYPVA